MRLAGSAGTIENCHVTDSVTVHGKSYTGGVAGYVNTGITKSSNAAKVTSEGSNVGGITGNMNGTNMLACYNSGTITGASLVGGLAGALYSGGTIDSCYNTGTVKATKGVAGGLLGNFRSGTLTNSYTSTLSEAKSAGSVAGHLEWSSGQKTLNKVYVPASDLETVGDFNGCTIQNGAAKSKTADELRALTAEELGDKFKADTKKQNGGYPILKWQDPAATEPEDPDRPESDPNGWDGKETSIPTQTDGVYQIGTAAKLKWFADAVETDSTIKGVLTQNIDLNHRDWTPVNANFAGELDGAGAQHHKPLLQK